MVRTHVQCANEITRVRTLAGVQAVWRVKLAPLPSYIYNLRHDITTLKTCQDGFRPCPSAGPNATGAESRDPEGAPFTKLLQGIFLNDGAASLVFRFLAIQPVPFDLRRARSLVFAFRSKLEISHRLGMQALSMLQAPAWRADRVAHDEVVGKRS